MKRNLPPLSWLRAFEASARHLSFTHAGSELGLTQSAVSKQVRLLEQHLREPLFERQARSLLLTKVGAAYLPKIRDAFERLADGTEEVFGHRRSDILTVRSAVGFSVNWLGSRLPRFYEKHPKTAVRIVSSVWNDEFDKESFDLDIRYGTGKWPGVRSDRLTWEELTPLCTPSLTKGKNALRKPQDLAAHKLIHVLGYEEGWAIWLRAAKVKDIQPDPGLQFDHSLVAFEVAATGVGVALGRTSMLEAELVRSRLVRPFALTVPIEEAFHVVSALNGSEHPDARVFRDWLIEEAMACKAEAERS